MSDVEKLAAVLAPAFEEWLFRMHGITSSCDHAAEAEGLAETILASDWLRERDGTNRILGAIRGAADCDEGYTALGLQPGTCSASTGSPMIRSRRSRTTPPRGPAATRRGMCWGGDGS